MRGMLRPWSEGLNRAPGSLVVWGFWGDGTASSAGRQNTVNGTNKEVWMQFSPPCYFLRFGISFNRSTGQSRSLLKPRLSFYAGRFLKCRAVDLNLQSEIDHILLEHRRNTEWKGQSSLQVVKGLGRLLSMFDALGASEARVAREITHNFTS